MPSDRTALLIRCSKEEAEKIRAAAKRAGTTYPEWLRPARHSQSHYHPGEVGGLRSRTPVRAPSAVVLPITFLQLFRQLCVRV